MNARQGPSWMCLIPTGLTLWPPNVNRMELCICLEQAFDNLLATALTASMKGYKKAVVIAWRLEN